MSNGTGASANGSGGKGPQSVWQNIQNILDELHSHQFSASNAPAISAIEAQLKQAQAGALRAYDSHLAYATGTRHHDTRSLNSKLGGHGGGGGGLGGGGLAGPGSLGGFPFLGKVPAGAAGASTPAGTNPMAIVIVLAIAGVGGYLLYHKLRMAHAQNKALDAGKAPPSDAAG